MEKKKSSIGYIIVIILLILGFVGYILFDRGIINFSKKTPPEAIDKVEELDVNSRLVQNLYNSVSNEYESGWLYYWRYSESYDNIYDIKDFYTESSSETIKMNLVSKNLSKGYEKIIGCTELNIPNNISGDFRSVCYQNELSDVYEAQTYYERKYVEEVYKKIFGSDATLDTSIQIKNDFFGTTTYVYFKEYDAYFEYKLPIGGTFDFGGYEASLIKAEKIGKKLYIYEDVVLEKYAAELAPDQDMPEKISTEEFKMVYTFELEDDGMYKFVSRVKKDK